MKKIIPFCVLAAFTLSLIVQTGCQINSTKELFTTQDSIAIARQVLSLYHRDNLPSSWSQKMKSDYNELYKLAGLKLKYKYNASKKVSQPIPFDSARYFHMNYLNWASTIITAEENAIHHFRVNPEELNNLAEKGKENGLRLYLGLDENKFLNIMLVPVTADGGNDVTYVVDKLLPCPDACVKNEDHRSGMNDKTDFNWIYSEEDADTLWLKPNIIHNGQRGWWVKKDNTPVKVAP